MQNNSIDNIRLDINREMVKAAVYVRSGDTMMRTIHCTLADHGEVIDLSEASIVNFIMKKADGTEVDNGCVVVGNEIQYTFRTNDVAAVGENKAQFVITFNDLSIITSPEFSVYVYQKVLNENVIQSENEYGVISQYITETKNYSEEAQSAAVESNLILEQVRVSERTLSDLSDEINRVESEILEINNDCLTYSENAKASEDKALEYSSNARVSEENAGAYADNAKEYAESVVDKVALAETYANQSKQYSEDSEASAMSIGDAEARVNAVKTDVLNAETRISTIESRVVISEASAKTSEDNAKDSENNSKASEDASKAYKDQCEEFYNEFIAGGGGEGVKLGTTHSTAGYGDWTETAYNHSQETGNPHGLTLSDIGAEESGAAAQALASAKEYASNQDAIWGGNIARYVDEQDAATLESAKTYAAEKDSETLQSAYSYANGREASAKAYADEQDATTLASAKTYSDDLVKDGIDVYSEVTEQGVTPSASDSIFGVTFRNKDGSVRGTIGNYSNENGNCGTSMRAISQSGNTERSVYIGVNDNTSYISSDVDYARFNKVRCNTSGDIASGDIYAVTGGALYTALSNKQNTLSVSSVAKDNISISADGNASGTIDATKSGYTPVGIVGWTIGNASSSGANYYYSVPLRAYITGSNVSYIITNYSTTKTLKVKATFYVLYKKN